MIYLDQAATSLLKPVSVSHAMIRAMERLTSPGRGGYRPAMEAAETVFRCRELASELFHVPSPEQVVFTMNATHGLNIAIRSLVRPGGHVVISGFEHNAVTRPLHAMGVDVRVAGRRLFEPEDTLQDFAQLLPGADAAVCTYVSNAFGYVLPLDAIAALCRREGVPLVVDASQAAGVLPLDLEDLGAAFIAMPGHKGLFGPQGTGILLCGERGTPLLFGGSGSESRAQTMPADLPERLEAGTQNVCGIAGLLAGLQYVRDTGTETILAKERSALRAFRQALEGSYELFCGTGESQCGVLSLRHPAMDCESLGSALAEKGICARAGLHCAPLAHESAGTLDTGTLRLSFSPFLDAHQLSEACRILLALV